MSRLTFCAALLAAAVSAPAQYRYFAPAGSYAVEVSLENSEAPRLPIYRNAITSLEVAGDFAIGGTSAEAGLSPYLFAVSLTHRKLEMILPLDRVVAGQRAVESGFGRGPDGWLYAGTMPQAAGASGHLIRVRAGAGRLQVEDVGTPVPSQGIFAVTADAVRGAVYGIAYPSGSLFVFHTAGGATEVHAETALGRAALQHLTEYVIRPEDVLSRRLAIDRAGRVYGSCPVNRLFRFDPAAGKVEFLPAELPDVAGRRALGRVDSWAVAPDGTLYGGAAADAQLFHLDPASGKLVNLGKPAMMPRIKGMAFGRDGKLYGVTGAPPGYTHVFVYDAATGFADFGNPMATMKAEGIEQGIPWRSFQIGTVAASEDGRYLVMGEEESLSQILVFPVGAGR